MARRSRASQSKPLGLMKESMRGDHPSGPAAVKLPPLANLASSGPSSIGIGGGGPLVQCSLYAHMNCPIRCSRSGMPS
eukprot:1655559-Alexandrium_andersonii.AAC.1